MAWGLFWHLRYVTRWDSRRLGSMVGAVVLGFGLLVQAQDLLGNEDFSTVAELPPLAAAARRSGWCRPPRWMSSSRR